MLKAPSVMVVGFTWLVLRVVVLGQETPSSTEANPAAPAPGHSVHGEAFDEGPRHRAYLMDGMGRIHFPVSAENPEVQDLVNQGVGQLHSFYYLEAERSFRTAALLDPGCPLAYWGMAMANTNNEKRARAFLTEAREKARTREITRKERLYLDALGGKYKEKADGKARRKAWLEGLETIVQEFPEDLDARAWMAMVTWENAGKGDGIGSRQAVDMVLKSVLAVEPLHPGAHHYTIHLWDSVKPEVALGSAGQYAGTAPGIAHAWHMPGHTYTGLKRYGEAAYQQEGSARVDHAMMLRDRVMPFEIHNYAHNNQWLATSYSHIGRVRDGLAVARNLVEQPRDPQKNRQEDGGSAQRSGRMRWAELLSRYERWSELVDETKSGRLDWSDLPLEQVQKAYFLGQAYAALGDREALVEQVQALEGLKPKPEEKKAKEEEKEEGEKDESKPEPEKKKPAETPKSPEGLEAALAELEGYEKLLDGNHDAAFDRFKKATSMRKEALARAYLKAGRVDDAGKEARLNVERNPGQLPPLVALVEILHQTGETAESQKAYEKLKPLLAQADSDLPVLARLVEIRGSWEATGWKVEEECCGADESGRRSILEALGPLEWSPYEAPGVNLTDSAGNGWSLTQQRDAGRWTILVFFLGGQCAHCMQQLQLLGQEFEAFRALGADVVAVSTDDLETTRELKHNQEGIKFPMLMLPDPGLEVFRSYRSHDDFEEQPLHGVFLIDEKGGVRFHRVSSEPFLDVEFLKAEMKRLKR